MAKIIKIEQKTPAIKAKKKVAAYARISMESERMSHSLSAQISYYSALIQRNPDWEYAGVYADDGISGTGIDKRDEFKRMLSDAEQGNIDIILTKSIQRFARNTVDLLETVRHLKDIGVEVRFEKENINSMSGDGELMMTILASFAQEESRSISDNVKWGIRKRMEQGIPNGKFRVYGYQWDGNDLVIVPKEAEIVRRIFQNFLDGKSRLETEREFAAEGITTRAGKRWTDSNLKSVLTNITYTGNLLLQKEYVSDPISKKRKKNHGEMQQFYVEDNHEPIIDKVTFDYVQTEMARRKEYASELLRLMKYTNREDIELDSRKRYEAIAAIYGELKKKRKTVSNVELMVEINNIISEYVQVEQAAEGIVPSRQFDISQIDFDLLRREFAKAKKKNLVMKDLEDLIRVRLEAMLFNNPDRIKYHERYQQIIEEYNSQQDRATIEKTFDELMQLVKDMDQEEQRYVREGFSSDEELSLYDMLFSENLSKQDIQKIKQVAVDLLQKVKVKIAELDHWTDKQETKATIDNLIRDTLWSELPECYDELSISGYRQRIYEYVYTRYKDVA